MRTRSLRNRLSFHGLLLFMACILPICTFSQNFVKTSAETVGMSSERLKYLTNTIEEYVKNEELPGAVVLIARRGQIAYLNAFGKSDIESGVKMKENSIFRIASQTKAIVSVGVMILHEQGKLLIRDPVGKYLPAFMETTVAVPKEAGGYEIVKANRPITIRDLLTHTGGIGYEGGVAEDVWEKAGLEGGYFADQNEPIQAAISRIAGLPFQAQPGEKFIYGYSTDILGALIEVVSGDNLDVFLKSNVLDPLEMNDTHFYLPLEKKDRLTTVYNATEKGLERAPESAGIFGQGSYVNGPRTCFSGGAGYLSTVLDYAKFLQMMLNKGEFNGNRIISRKTVELMTANHLETSFDDVYDELDEGIGFGLGFYVMEDVGKFGNLGSIGEFGWFGIYHTAYWVDPVEELVVVYMTQVFPEDDIYDMDKVRALVYQSIID